MLRSYICCNHREWLRDQPEQAIHVYAKARSEAGRGGEGGCGVIW